MKTKPIDEPKQKRRRKTESLPLCRLREIRAVQNRSIAELSQSIGIHRNIIARIEKGLQIGILPIHLRLISALGVSADEYFGLISSKPLSDEPEILDSRKGFTVELLPAMSGKVFRIQIAQGESASLRAYLDSEKPVFLYVTQGTVLVQRNKESFEQNAGASLSFPRASGLAIKNASSLGGVLLAFQC